MALTFLIVLATTHLEDANLVVLAVRHDRGRDGCAGHQGRANLDLSAVADSQNLVDHDFLANVRSNLFYFNFLAGSNAILLAAGFYDCVHRYLSDLSKNLRSEFREAFHVSTTGPIAHLAQACSGRLPIISYDSRTCAHATRIRPLPAPQEDLSTTAAVLRLVADDMAEVDQVISARLSTGVPLVSQVSRYIIAAGGKRLRPTLLLLMSGALGYSGRQHFNLAAVVEFIHTATLLHDDVVDESTLRRGRPTANESFGNAASVLVGDFLYSRAFQMMLEAQNMRVMEILAEATNVIAEGEVMQLMNMGDASLDEAAYLQVIRSKTAKLFEASTRLAAVLAGASAELEEACATYGQALGTAFQVIDDLLDYEGDAAETGKNVGDDLREGKTTLPLILAMQRAQPEQAELIRNAIEQGDVQQLPQIVDIVRRSGALQATRDAAAQEAQRAIHALRALPQNSHSEGLLQLAAQLLQRRA